VWRDFDGDWGRDILARSTTAARAGGTRTSPDTRADRCAPRGAAVAYGGGLGHQPATRRRSAANGWPAQSFTVYTAAAQPGVVLETRVWNTRFQ
jgi:hypothetical protein